MTVGKLMELLGSKAGVLEGKFHYGTGKTHLVCYFPTIVVFIWCLPSPSGFVQSCPWS